MNIQRSIDIQSTSIASSAYVPARGRNGADGNGGGSGGGGQMEGLQWVMASTVAVFDELEGRTKICLIPISVENQRNATIHINS